MEDIVGVWFDIWILNYVYIDGVWFDIWVFCYWI